MFFFLIKKCNNFCCPSSLLLRYSLFLLLKLARQFFTLLKIDELLSFLGQKPQPGPHIPCHATTPNPQSKVRTAEGRVGLFSHCWSNTSSTHIYFPNCVIQFLGPNTPGPENFMQFKNPPNKNTVSSVIAGFLTLLFSHQFPRKSEESK